MVIKKRAVLMVIGVLCQFFTHIMPNISRIDDMDGMGPPSDHMYYTACKENVIKIYRSCVKYIYDTKAFRFLFKKSCPLHHAVDEGNVSEVHRLIQEGYDVNEYSGKVGGTSLCLAIKKRDGRTFEQRCRIMQALIEAGADLHKESYEKSPLHHTVHEKNGVKMAQLLLDAGADINKSYGSYWNTLLHEAGEERNFEFVHFLLNDTYTRESLINKQNSLDYTPLKYIIAQVTCAFDDHEYEDYKKIVRILLEHGADQHIKNYDGTTPYENAQRYGLEDVARILKNYSDQTRQGRRLVLEQSSLPSEIAEYIADLSVVPEPQ